MKWSELTWTNLQWWKMDNRKRENSTMCRMKILIRGRKSPNGHKAYCHGRTTQSVKNISEKHGRCCPHDESGVWFKSWSGTAAQLPKEATLPVASWNCDSKNSDISSWLARHWKNFCLKTTGSLWIFASSSFRQLSWRLGHLVSLNRFLAVTTQLPQKNSAVKLSAKATAKTSGCSHVDDSMKPNYLCYKPIDLYVQKLLASCSGAQPRAVSVSFLYPSTMVYLWLWTSSYNSKALATLCHTIFGMFSHSCNTSCLPDSNSSLFSIQSDMPILSHYPL